MNIGSIASEPAALFHSVFDERKRIPLNCVIRFAVDLRFLNRNPSGTQTAWSSHSPFIHLDMTRLRSVHLHWFLAALIGALLFPSCATGPAEKEVTISATKKPGVTRTGEVYLLRGFAGVFSTGMDGIGTKMKAKGLNVKVASHAGWNALANDIVKRSKTRGGVSYPIIIMGHSLGANASAKMATYLGEKGIRVSYVVAFDPTQQNSVGRNVSRVTNYYVGGGDGEGPYSLFRRGSGFRGRLENVNLGRDPKYQVHHFNIEKNTQLQSRVVNTAYSLTRRLR